MGTALQTAIDELRPVIASATREAVNGTSEMLQTTPQEHVVKEVAAVVVNQTNQEPWYQSRVTWGAILTIVASILAIFGYQLPDELRGDILDVIEKAGPLIGALVVIYGRWFAKKPLGA